MVDVPVGEKNLRHLFRFAAKGSHGVHIAADVFPGVGKTALIRHFLGGSGRQAGIHQDDLFSGVNQIVLQASPIADVFVKCIHALFSAEGKGLGIETVFSEFFLL